MENDNDFFLRNHINVETILFDLHKQILLEIFRRVCKHLSEGNNNSEFKELVRSRKTESGTMLVYRNLISLVTPLQVSDEDIYMIREWIAAFWEKSDQRKPIPDEFRQKLLKKQNFRCACCGKNIEHVNHVDHIIPFKYSGDELPEENYRCLCAGCNLDKSAILATLINDICTGMYSQKR